MISKHTIFKKKIWILRTVYGKHLLYFSDILNIWQIVYCFPSIDRSIHWVIFFANLHDESENEPDHQAHYHDNFKGRHYMNFETTFDFTEFF